MDSERFTIHKDSNSSQLEVISSPRKKRQVLSLRKLVESVHVAPGELIEVLIQYSESGASISADMVGSIMARSNINNEKLQTIYEVALYGAVQQDRRMDMLKEDEQIDHGVLEHIWEYVRIARIAKDYLDRRSPDT